MMNRLRVLKEMTGYFIGDTIQMLTNNLNGKHKICGRTIEWLIDNGWLKWIVEKEGLPEILKYKRETSNQRTDADWHGASSAGVSSADLY